MISSCRFIIRQTLKKLYCVRYFHRHSHRGNYKHLFTMEQLMENRPPTLKYEEIANQVESYYEAKFEFVKMLPSERDLNYLLKVIKANDVP